MEGDAVVRERALVVGLPPWAWSLLAPLALAMGVGGAIATLAPDALLASAALVGLYVVTPLGKEAWLALATPQFGLPLVYAAALLLAVEATFCLAALALPLDRVPAKRLERLRARLARSRLARHGLAAGLFGVLVLPFHSGGAVVGTLTGRSVGLGRRATAAAVLGAASCRLALVVLALQGIQLLR